MKLRKPAVWLLRIAPVMLVVLIVGAKNELTSDIEGFTEPFRTIDVAAAETGIVAQLDVREGDSVEKGQVLGSLDCDLLNATLDIAKKQMEAKGQLNSADAELQLRTERVEKLRILRESDHASQEELDRAETEVAVAEARVLTAREALEIKELEYKRIKVQLGRRNIRSPIDGFIMQFTKYEGEYVAPTDPAVMTIVQLDPLLATFSVPPGHADRLTIGQDVKVKIANQKRPVNGTVEFVSPVTDAQSGTVKVKVRLPNAEAKYRSGEKCLLQLAAPAIEHLTRK